MKKIKVKKDNSGKRIDVFLVEKMPNKSRTLIQKEIKNKKILVNKKNISSNYKVKEEDVIEFKENIEEGLPNSSLENEGNKNKKEGSLNSLKENEDNENKKEKKESFGEVFEKIKIIKKTKDYLVLYKPAGLTVHGAPHIKEKTLADWLIKKYPKIKKIGDDPFRPGIVHRLDKNVSGLILIALNNSSFENFKNQFKKRKIKKEYIALVYGAINKESDIIDFSIRRASSGHKMAAVPYIKEGSRVNKKIKKLNDKSRKAISEFKVIKKFINYTLLTIKIKTGRTHQIRVHMFAYNHPIVGDKLYYTKKTKEKNIKLKTKRVFLQASKLCFLDMNDEKICFNLESDQEFSDMLNNVK
jgi:23S rRNA pseudouridine1911/1915/1917 synthase